MGIPVSGGCLDRCHHLIPGLKAPAFERKPPQDLPPGFNQVQIGCVPGLVDKFPARMRDHEEQQIMAMMHVQVVHDGVDALLVLRNVLIDKAEKVDEMLCDAPGITLRPARSGGFPQRTVDLAFGSASIINLLFGSLSGTSVDINDLLAWVAFGSDWSHLINVEDDAVGGSFLSQGFEGPLFCTNSGSSRSPNQVSCLRHRNPSACKISKMRVFFMCIPSCSWIEAARRSKVQLV